MQNKNIKSFIFQWYANACHIYVLYTIYICWFRVFFGSVCCATNPPPVWLFVGFINCVRTFPRGTRKGPNAWSRDCVPYDYTFGVGLWVVTMFLALGKILSEKHM